MLAAPFREAGVWPMGSSRSLGTTLDRVGQPCRGACLARAERERRTLSLVPFVAVDQSRRPALADIIGARRVRTAVMISSGSMPCR